MSNENNTEYIEMENEGRRNALRQLITITADEMQMLTYSLMSGIDYDKLPDMRREWITELRALEGHPLTLDEIKANAIKRTHLLLARALETPIAFDGKQYRVTLEKQTLLSAQLGLFSFNAQAGNPTELQWNATGEPCVPWEFEALLALSNAIADHVKPLAQMQRDVEVEVRQSKNETEVNGYVKKYAKALDKAVNV